MSANIENEFNKLNEIIDCAIKEEKIDNIKPEIYGQYDKEYLKLKVAYKGKKSNLNFIKYNYYLRKVYQANIENNSKLDMSLVSVLSFLEINTHAPEKFIMKINHMIKNIKVNTSEDLSRLLLRLISFIKFEMKDKSILSKQKKEKIVEICYYYLVQIKKFVDSINIADKIDNDNYNKIRNQMIDLFNNIQSVERDKKAASILAEFIYRIGKKQSNYMVRFLYFEEKAEYRETILSDLKIAIENMEFYSNKSLKIFNKIYKDEEHNDYIRLTRTLKEVDQRMAKYYKLIYYDKNTNSAWKEMRDLKEYLIIKILKENIDISDNLMNTIVDECNLLQAFNKVSLLKNEILILSNNSNIKWIKETLNEINKEFENIEKLFKYDENKSNVTKLENVDDSFMGSFIEYMLHDLILYIKKNQDKVKKEVTQTNNRLFKDIVESNDIILNHIIVQGKPDIDINLEGKTAILIKNAKIKREEFKTITEELYIVYKDLTYKKCYYLINFSKNLENIASLKQKFKNYEEDYNMSIELVDIKIFFNDVLNLLKNPKQKYNFSEKQLYKMFGY